MGKNQRFSGLYLLSFRLSSNVQPNTECAQLTSEHVSDRAMVTLYAVSRPSESVDFMAARGAPDHTTDAVIDNSEEESGRKSAKPWPTMSNEELMSQRTHTLSWSLPIPTSRRYPTGNDPNLPGKSYLAHQRRFTIITWRDNDREKRRRNRELSLFISLSLRQMACESYDIESMHNEFKMIFRTCRKAIMIETMTFKCDWIVNLHSLVSSHLISTRHSQCLRSTRAPLPQ